MANFAVTNYATNYVNYANYTNYATNYAMNVSATPNFVLGRYFKISSYLCLSPVTPQAELVYFAAITGPWKFVGFHYPLH